MNKYLNDSNFKLLVFLPLIYVILNFTLAFVYFSMNYGDINQNTVESIDSLSLVVAVIFSIVMFRRDLSFLRENNAYCPSWGWYFIFPVYIYKRQKKQQPWDVLFLGISDKYILTDKGAFKDINSFIDIVYKK